MNYYSDPTASKAIGNIDREFSKKTKKAKQLCKLYKRGQLSAEDLENARKEFKGLYRFVLENALENPE